MSGSLPKFFEVIRRKGTLLVCCYLLLISFAGVYGQKSKERKKDPDDVKDLFNTSSCIPKPYRCPHRQIEFFLYTRRTQQNPELINTLDIDSLYQSHFNRAHPTKIVIHGFGGGRNLSPSTDMRDAYFHRGQYNVIIVDYGTLVKEPCLSQMEWAPKFCAKCIAQLIRYLTQHPRGIRADDMHIIGYSVGAHIGGLIANYIDPEKDGKLGRITGKAPNLRYAPNLRQWTFPGNMYRYLHNTHGIIAAVQIGNVCVIASVNHRLSGLDPTIFFYKGQNTSRDLDPSDAHFVDVLHTGAGILGQWGPSGHADFYINGGSSQPGCGSDTVFKTLACDHTKVTPYFIESIVTKRGFWAFPCPTLISFMVGWCTPQSHEYVLMGEHVTHSARGNYYVRTNADPPWAQGPPKEIKEKITREALPILQRLRKQISSKNTY